MKLSHEDLDVLNGCIAAAANDGYFQDQIDKAFALTAALAQQAPSCTNPICDCDEAVAHRVQQAQPECRCYGTGHDRNTEGCVYFDSQHSQ